MNQLSLFEPRKLPDCYTMPAICRYCRTPQPPGPALPVTEITDLHSRKFTAPEPVPAGIHGVCCAQCSYEICEEMFVILAMGYRSKATGKGRDRATSWVRDPRQPQRSRADAESYVKRVVDRTRQPLTA